MSFTIAGKFNANLPPEKGNLRRTFVIAFFVLVIIAFGACIQKNTRATGATAQILLFNGTGASTNDVAALQAILDDNHLDYTTVNSPEFNGMAELELRKYRLLIIPGGNFIDMGKNLSPATMTKTRSAVKCGLNYLGICAGGFLAGSSAYYNSFKLVPGVSFGFYAAENRGIHKAAVAITTPGAPALDQYWEDGPQFTGWGAVAGKYPDGTPAIVQGVYGKGKITLIGFHAEAPENWRTGINFNTPAAVDNTYGGLLIRTALNGEQLPHY